MGRKILIAATLAMMVYHHRLELIKKLIKVGYEVIIVAPEDSDTSRLVDLGCTFISVPIQTRGKNIIKDLALCFRLVNIIRTQKPDVVLTFYTKTNIYGAIASRITGVPYITNVTGMGSAIENGGYMRAFMISLYKIAIKKADCVFFQNKYNQQFFDKYKIHSGHCRLIPGSGVCLEKFNPLEYPETEEPIKILYISRILQEKGIEQVIEAAKYFVGKKQRVVFDIVGPSDNEYLEKLKDLNNKKILNYYGKQSNVQPFLQNCHCLIFPSYYSEGMANVLLEASSSARPVITTARPGCGETVDDGITGFIVNEHDSADLIDKINKFVQLPLSKKREMGIQARKKMEREFDREKVVKAYMEEINNIKMSHRKNMK